MRRLCRFQRSFKLTLQRRINDVYSNLEAMKPRYASNLAKFIASVVADFHISLTLLEHSAFYQFKHDSVNVLFFKTLLGVSTVERVLAAGFERIAAQPGLEELHDDILYFVHRFLDPALALRRLGDT